ncbi:MerR family transcriptional regulator [Tenggerimyces flavus]|uniref:MerR family transcriptional regulator n=1 Tax=Tenggerimyces flavus TaxID=1708749 RepID=A0ABV7Y7V7_9ACTN|nr:MerR family transcriptional regulator [Tenggerimyces flavus]MBM7791072.1 DNA-binding transcriptional MerR regulator [Tenggerimyces flavus]
MRIAELSRRTAVPVPTIKYYVREGLVPRGELTSRNQATYDERHERRIRLVRALIDIGGLSIATTRDLLGQLDNPEASVDSLLGRTMLNLNPSRERVDDETRADAAARVQKLVHSRGWRIDAHDPTFDVLIDLVAAMRALGEDDLLEILDTYAEAAEKVAAIDLAVVSRRKDLESIIDGAVVGTVLGGSMLLALRRLAHIDASGRVFRPES